MDDVIHCMFSDWALQYSLSSPDHVQPAALAHLCDAG